MVGRFQVRLGERTGAKWSLVGGAGLASHLSEGSPGVLTGPLQVLVQKVQVDLLKMSEHGSISVATALFGPFPEAIPVLLGDCKKDAGRPGIGGPL